MSYLKVDGTLFKRDGNPSHFLLEHPDPMVTEDCLPLGDSIRVCRILCYGRYTRCTNLIDIEVAKKE